MFTSKLIEARRKEEDSRRVVEEAARADSKLKSAAVWEVKSDQVRAVANERQKTKRELESANQDLERRRQALRNLLEDDNVKYKKELDALSENPEQLRTRLTERAATLKAIKEEKRSAIVEQKLKQQFRESHDELRQLKSQAIMEECVIDCENQLKYKEEERKREFEIESKWAKLWEWDRLKKQEREEKELQERSSMNKEMRKIVDNQLEAVNQRKQAELQQKLLETKQLQEHIEREEKRAIEADILKNNKKKQIQHETAQFNQEYQKQKAALRAAEIELERQITEAASEGLAEEKQRQIDMKERKRQEMIDYVEYLQKLKADERLMNSEMERLCKLEQDAAFAKRSIQWDKEKKAREDLMKEVAITREQQLAEKQRIVAAHAAESKTEREKLSDELAKLEIVEKRRSEELKAKQLKQKLDLQQQIVEREAQRLAEAAKIEAEYQARKLRDDQMVAKLAKEMAENRPRAAGRK